MLVLVLAALVHGGDSPSGSMGSTRAAHGQHTGSTGAAHGKRTQLWLCTGLGGHASFLDRFSVPVALGSRWTALAPPSR